MCVWVYGYHYQNSPTECQSSAQSSLRIFAHRDQTNLQDLVPAAPSQVHYTCRMVQSSTPVEFHLQNHANFITMITQNVSNYKTIIIQKTLSTLWFDAPPDTIPVNLEMSIFTVDQSTQHTSPTFFNPKNGKRTVSIPVS